MPHKVRSIGGGRKAHGKENPRAFYAAGLRARPARLVRGSSRRITIMRFRPANISVINRRDSRFDHLRCCVCSTMDRSMYADPAVCAGPAFEGGLLAGLDVGADTM
jgi:hypothetical protein